MSAAMVRRVAVIGAGIGGLAAAIALQARGLRVDVYEKAPAVGEGGAGISLGANGVRLLDLLGLGAEVRRLAAEPHRIQFHHWRSGEIFYQHPMGDWYTGRFGAPHLGVHRADLQRALLQRFSRAVRFGHDCTAIRESGDGVELSFGNGVIAAADLVIGADGVRSGVRRHLAGADEMVFSAMSCFRGLVPVEKVPGGDEFGLTFFLGPGRHIVAYPVRSGTLINFVAYLPDPVWTLESWTAEGDPAAAVAAFAGWNETVTTLLGAVERTSRWALYDREPLARWSTGRVTLLGDAAHPMLPHAGQGTNQAIEDAVVLARLLSAPDLPVPEALRQYELRRRPRTRLLQAGARANAVCCQLPDGPAAQARNAGFATLPETVAGVHGYDAEADLGA